LLRARVSQAQVGNTWVRGSSERVDEARPPRERGWRRALCIWAAEACKSHLQALVRGAIGREESEERENIMFRGWEQRNDDAPRGSHSQSLPAGHRHLHHVIFFSLSSALVNYLTARHFLRLFCFVSRRGGLQPDCTSSLAPCPLSPSPLERGEQSAKKTGG
jgi:hypothetical protein